VEASLADANNFYYGTAIGELGPFDLDPSTRQSIDNAVAAGGARFPVRYFADASSGGFITESGSIAGAAGYRGGQFIGSILGGIAGDWGRGGSRDTEMDRSQDYMIHVSDTDIRLVKPGLTERFNKEIGISYAGDLPRVLIHPLDTTKFRMIVNDGDTTNNMSGQKGGPADNMSGNQLQQDQQKIKVMHFAALSRQSRDLISLTIRVFYGTK
jgi:hypothetical protein